MKTLSNSKTLNQKLVKILFVLTVLAVVGAAGLLINRQISQGEAMQWTKMETQYATLRICLVTDDDRVRVKINNRANRASRVEFRQTRGSNPPHVNVMPSSTFGTVRNLSDNTSGQHRTFQFKVFSEGNPPIEKEVRRRAVKDCHNLPDPPRNDNNPNARTVQQLANEILRHDNIIFSDGARVPFTQLARGELASTTSPEAPAPRTTADPKLLELAIALADNVSVPIRISSFTNGEHERPSSRHYVGHAFDIGNEENASQIMPFLRRADIRSRYGITDARIEGNHIHVAT